MPNQKIQKAIDEFDHSSIALYYAKKGQKRAAANADQAAFSKTTAGRLKARLGNLAQKERGIGIHDPKRKKQNAERLSKLIKTEKHKANISKALKKRPKSDEHKLKSSQTWFKKGRTPYNKGSESSNKGMKYNVSAEGRLAKQEAIARTKAAGKFKPNSTTFKKGRTTHNAQKTKFLFTDTGKSYVFNSLTEGCRFFRLDASKAGQYRDNGKKFKKYPTLDIITL